MKLLSLGLAFGLLLASSPLLARTDCDGHKKCKIEGTYAGGLSDESNIVAQFHADGTLTLTNAGSYVFLGTWKSIGNNCYTFCAINEGLDENDGFIKYEGTLRFDADCKFVSADEVRVTRYERTDECLSSTPEPTVYSLGLCRICCS